MERERKYERGQVYYLQDRDSWGREMSMGRPVIILTNFDEYTKREVVNCMFMTSKEKPCGINVKLSSTNRQSWALCNQIATVDIRRFGQYMCTLNSREMEQIDENLKIVLGLKEFKPRELEEEILDDIPVEVDEIQAKVESELYQKLYTKAMADLVEARYKLDELQIKYERIGKGLQPKVREVHRDDGISVDLDKLKKSMQTPNAEMTGELVEPVGRDESVPASLGKCSGGRGNVRGRAKLAENAKPTNVNTATLEDFIALGISEATSRDIVRYRKKHGRFRSVEELLDVPRFGAGCMGVFGSMLRV
jgi:mRNA-degrading endonuclease toxin of MazEF toxin-antitoxin module